MALPECCLCVGSHLRLHLCAICRHSEIAACFISLCARHHSLSKVAIAHVACCCSDAWIFRFVYPGQIVRQRSRGVLREALSKCVPLPSCFKHLSRSPLPAGVSYTIKLRISDKNEPHFDAHTQYAGHQANESTLRIMLRNRTVSGASKRYTQCSCAGVCQTSRRTMKRLSLFTLDTSCIPRNLGP